MAGSFNHVCDDNGTFRFDLIENLGDAHEACEQMHALIMKLSGGDPAKVRVAMDAVQADRMPSNPINWDSYRNYGWWIGSDLTQPEKGGTP